MKFMNFAMSVLLISALALVGCKKDDPVANAGAGGGGSTGTIVVTVGTGLNPSYTWSGGNIFQLSVVRTAAPTNIVWGAVTPGVNNIASGVVQGTLPAGAVQTSFSGTENTLTAGVQYRVNVTRLDGSFGFTDFTR